MTTFQPLAVLCCHMTTNYTRLDIEQLHISLLRPDGAIPTASAIDVDKARLYGLGILPSIKARPIDNHEYEILSGLTTWRVAQYLCIGSIDAQVLDINDDLAREMIADDFAPTLKRRNPVHEAQAIKDLSRVEAISPTRIGHRLEYDRHTVSILMRLLKLPRNILDQIESGGLPLGKAKMLLTLSPDLQYDLAEKAINEKWSTRRMEEEVRHLKKGGPATIIKQSQPKAKARPQKSPEQDPEIKREQERLTDLVGSPIFIDHDTKTGHGQIVINYSNLDVFTGIAERLEATPTPRLSKSEWDD